MSLDHISKLHFYSLGIVAANKEVTSDTIEVVPIEEFPMLDGEVTDNKYKYEVSYKDGNNKPANLKLDTTVSIPAEWLPISNSNRRSSPDVRRGETVVLYSFGDSNKVFWNTLKNDIRLRRLETVIYGFSNNSKENVRDTPDSTYFLEVSTHKKIMHVHTSKNDGEPFSYDVQINAKDGFVVITDDIGNYFELKSGDSRIRAQNNLGTSVTIEKEVATVIAKMSIIDSPETLITGNVTIKGNLNTGGNIAGGGTIMDASGNSNHHSH